MGVPGTVYDSVLDGRGRVRSLAAGTGVLENASLGSSDGEISAVQKMFPAVQTFGRWRKGYGGVDGLWLEWSSWFP